MGDIILRETIAVRVNGVTYINGRIRVRVETRYPSAGVPDIFDIWKDELVSDEDYDILLGAIEHTVLCMQQRNKYIIKTADYRNGVENKQMLALLATKEFLLEDGSIAKMLSKDDFDRKSTKPFFENVANDIALLITGGISNTIVFDIFNGHVIDVRYTDAPINMTTMDTLLCIWHNCHGRCIMKPEGT